MSRADEVLDAIDHALSLYSGHEDEVLPSGVPFEEAVEWVDAMRWSPDVDPAQTGGSEPDTEEERRSLGLGQVVPTSNAAAGLRYIAERYRDPAAAADLWDATDYSSIRGHIDHVHVMPTVQGHRVDQVIFDETQQFRDGDYALRVFSERQRVAVGDLGPPPAPDTCHPYYASPADLIRSMMSERMHRIDVPRAVDSDAVFRFQVDTLTVHRCGRIGDNGRHETWQVAVDDQGRWVAGPVRLAPSYHERGPAMDLPPGVTVEQFRVVVEAVANILGSYADALAAGVRAVRDVGRLLTAVHRAAEQPVEFFDGLTWGDFWRLADLPPGVVEDGHAVRFAPTVRTPEPRAPRRPIDDGWQAEGFGSTGQAVGGQPRRQGRQDREQQLRPQLPHRRIR